MDMIQHTYCIFLNRIDHTIEHLESTHLVFYNRISLSISYKTDTLTKNLHVIDMIHPLTVDRFQKNHSLQFTQLLCFRELGFFCFIKFHSFFFNQMLDLVFSLAFYFLCSKWLNRNNRDKCCIELVQIPVSRIYVIREAHIYGAVYDVCDHLVDGITHVLAIQYLTTLFINDLTLLVINLVIIQKIFTNTKVVKLDLLLCFLDCIRKHLVFDLLVLCNTKRSKNLHQSLRTEQTHQVVFQRDIETGFTRVSLTSGTSTQLVIDTSGLVTLCTDDLQTTGFSCHIVKLDIGTTTSHVCSDGNGSCLSCLCNDLCFQFMELRVQYVVLDTFTAKHLAEEFRCLDGNGTNQNRLLFCMGFFNCLNNCVEFFFLCHVYGIFEVFTLYRSVSRDLYNVHSVDITELFFLGKSCTGHTALLIIFIKEVLECNSSKSLTLSLNLNMLFCFDCLMKSVRITTSRHDTSGKFINDKNLIIFYYVILVFMHQVMCTECKDDIVLDLQVFRICQVLDIEEFLNLLHTLLGKVYNLIFFIYYEVTGLDNFFAHDGSHLCHLMAGFTTFQLLCKDITHFIELRGLTALSGNDQRCTCLIDQDRVDLIDDTVVQISLYQLFFIDDHVITKVIKSQFVISYISNIASVCCTALFRFHVVQYNTNSQSKELMNFTHPLSISFCQIVIDCYDVNAFTFQCIQICRKCRNKGLTFTGLHLCDTALMKDDTTDDLYTVMFHTENSFCTFTYDCESLRKKIIQCLSLIQTFLELSGLIF